jgi:hypothetical protein
MWLIEKWLDMSRSVGNGHINDTASTNYNGGQSALGVFQKKFILKLLITKK